METAHSICRVVTQFQVGMEEVHGSQEETWWSPSRRRAKSLLSKMRPQEELELKTYGSDQQIDYLKMNLILP